MLRRSFLSLAAGTAAGAALPGIPALWAAEPTGKLAFLVQRDGKDVGHHQMDIVRTGNVLTVSSKTEIAVKAAIFTLYKFEQTSTESWRDGRLVSFAASTDDDGTVHRVEAQPRDGKLALIIDGKTTLVDPALAPASLGNPRLVEMSKLFDTSDGAPLTVSTRLVAEEPLTIKGAKLRAKRFAFTGDMRRDIWYDPSGTPVQVGFDGKDGSRIKFLLT